MNNVKEFLLRNKSVFIIGFVTLVVFIAIIVVSEQKRRADQNTKPNLVKVGEENENYYKVIQETQEETPAVEETPQSTQTPVIYPYTKEQETAFDQRYGVLEIKFTENGWVPKNTTSVVGQLVRWANTTGKPIYFKQKMPTYSELKDPILIDPGKSFEFRMYKNRLWTYEERISGAFGEFYVLDEITK